jgi:hypothetical protein
VRVSEQRPFAKTTVWVAESSLKNVTTWPACIVKVVGEGPRLVR